jgi:multiple sugar transport system substrate-binding protein
VQVTPSDQYLAKLLSQIAGGDAPDVAAVLNLPFPQFVGRNPLADLTPYLEQTENFSTDDFFPHLIDCYTVDGKVYGIPQDAQPFGLLMYNPALLEAAGVEEPTNDWTWEQLREAAQQFTKPNADGSPDQPQKRINTVYENPTTHTKKQD